MNDAKGKPMYRAIKDFLLEKIRSGELGPDDRIPSEKELMEAFGVSRITVRRALEELSIEGYIYKIQGLGAFVKSTEFEGESKGKLVGMVVTPMSDYLSMGIIKGVEDYLSKFGIHPLVQFSSGNVEDERRKLKNIIESGISGLIMMPHVSSIDNEYLRIFSKDHPVVFVDRSIDGFDVHTVQSENRKGARELIRHMINVHGSKRICFVTWEDLHVSSVRDRYMGAVEAAREGEAFVELINVDPENLGNVDFVEDCDTIFACTDLIAAEIMVSLEVLGKRVPYDVKVVGFDDRPFSRYLRPPLTTVRQFPELLGRKAAAVLMNLLRGEEMETKDHRVRVEFVGRESCGCLKTKSE